MPQKTESSRPLTELRVKVPDEVYDWLGKEAARFGLTIASFVRRELILMSSAAKENSLV